jgi:hypothetical protein
MPASPFTVYTLLDPDSSQLAAGKKATVAKALPEAYWQSRQWQAITLAGSPAQV